MDTDNASRIFEALSFGVRLDLLRLLARNTPDGLVAGAISEHLDISPSNLSFHLKGLVQSGLADVAREGRYRRYRINIPLMLEILAYLSDECCLKNPALCPACRNADRIKPEPVSGP